MLRGRVDPPLVVQLVVVPTKPLNIAYAASIARDIPKRIRLFYLPERVSPALTASTVLRVDVTITPSTSTRVNARSGPTVSITSGSRTSIARCMLSS